MKQILDRKNAKAVLELANKGLNAVQISKELGIWYNVANYLLKELKSAGLTSIESKVEKVDFKDVLKSSRKQVLIDMLNSGELISQKSIVLRTGLSRLPADVLDDLRELEKQNLIDTQVKGTSKLFRLK